MNVFNLSFGKDSMATLVLAEEQGIPIDHLQKEKGDRKTNKH